ncbi:MAG: c-type cytochrome [Ferruginibacter sp.]|nr:c-type cytochrome [Ferruginibacter sp.]
MLTLHQLNTPKKIGTIPAKVVKHHWLHLKISSMIQTDKKKKSKSFEWLLLLYLICPQITAQGQNKTTANTEPIAGLILPPNFSSSIIADKLGHARHIAITPQGDIFVRLSQPVNGKGTLVLHEQDGTAATTNGFGNFGGTGIAIKNGYLYTSSNEEVFRYKLNEKNEVIDAANPERIVTGLIDRGQHETKSLVLDNEGNLYVNIGAYSNSCQVQDRTPGSKGRQPCNILDSAGGIWMFRADKKDQSYADGIRYATGLRNVVGLDWNQQLNQLFVMQHGRDQLHDLFPDMYSIQQSSELPAECLYALKKGDNAGWPFIYYDPLQHKKILAPEYGGDGKKEGSNEYIDPVAAFPAHLAPNALLFYTGKMFPERYRNGAFIAFHGSWNRAPEPQAGFYVVFQPFENGKPSGKWEVFADGFSGSAAKTNSGRADHRPCGLAQGPDGSLYVSDDNKGTIYKIGYNAKTVALKPVAAAKAASAKPTAKAVKTEATTAKVASKPVTTTSFRTSFTGGKKLYTQYCLSCHQEDGGGVPNMNPPLIKTSYVQGDKTRLISVILTGLSRQKIDGETYTNVMAPYNFLNDKQIADLLTFIRNDFHNKASAVTPAEVKVVRAKK